MAKTTATKGDATIFVSVMSTEHFEFRAIGRTKAEAERAIVSKFNELAPKRMSRPALDDWYGIETYEMAFGKAIRI